MEHHKRQSVCPPGMEAARDQLHFSPAVRVGDTIWVSGQVGSDASVVPGGGMEAQVRLAFANLEAVLAAAGASLTDIVDLTTYHTHFHRDILAFVKVKDEFLPANYPAWTAIGVAELARPEYVIEIRAVAVRGSGSA